MGKYKIHIDREMCVGDQLCAQLAPGTFDLDGDGKAMVVDPDGDLPKYVKAAAKKCRLQAITLFDAETGDRVWPKRLC
jgi:ferredoxin